MKRVLFIIALLALSFPVACRQTETSESVNANNSLSSAAGTGNANAFTAANRTNTNQTNSAAAEAESLLLPKPVGFVNDFAKVLDEPTRARLEEMLNRLKQRAQIEFAVATIETTGKESIDDYSLTLARSWGIGSGPRGDGLLLLVAVRDRQWRIQVSKGVETDLPNDVVGELGRLMNEPFRAGNYGEGLTKCVEALIQRLGERRGFNIN